MAIDTCQVPNLFRDELTKCTKTVNFKTFFVNWDSVKWTNKIQLSFKYSNFEIQLGRAGEGL